MKSINGLILTIIMLSSLSSFAYYINNVQVYVAPAQVTAVTCNPFPTFLTCQTSTSGLNQYGLWQSSWTMHYLYPGQCQSSYVFTYYPYYFINGYAQANCY